MRPSSATSTSAPAGPARPLGAVGRRAALAALIAAAGALPPCGASEIAARARLDKVRAAIGEPISLSVTVWHEGNVAWEARSAGGSVVPFDVAQVEGPRPLSAEEAAAEPDRPAPTASATRWVFRLTAFEMGRLESPALRLRGASPGAAEPVEAAVPPLPLEIVPTVSDPNTQPADIRHGFALPRDWTAWIAAAGAAGAALVLGLLVWRRLRRRRPAPAPAPAPAAPRRPPHERCLEALEALLASGLLESGRVKEFHVRLSEILKTYLGEVYGFDAMDRTSREVLDLLPAALAPPRVGSEAGPFLEACDLVKFARHRPDRMEMEETIGRARRLVDLARPRPAPAAPPPGARPAAAGGPA